MSPLTEYKSSEALTRYFCPRCGASIANFEADEWEFATGVLDRTGDGVLNRVQLWIGDAGDGGAGLWLRGNEWERHMNGRQSKAVSFDEVKGMGEESRRKMVNELDEDVLRARCHCGTVRFEIARPDQRKGKEGKYPAGLDACTSCRTVTGFEITSWAFVPKSNISMGDGRPLDLDMMALSHYDTSPGVHRTFCSRCGANVFCYRGTEETDTIDIAVGLLESKIGARADDWMEWDHYGDKVVAWAGDALDQGLVDDLIQGIKSDNQERARTD